MKRRKILPITRLIKIADAAEFRHSQEPPLRIGDVVMLNSGGPKMMIVDFDRERVTCAWREYGARLTTTIEASFPRACVHRVSIIE